MTERCSASLRYVACVSYPRSGHHLTVRVLQQYFRSEFKYCQYYSSPDPSCCQSYPCTNASVTMTKNHDMELRNTIDSGIPKVQGVPYLVLVRNFLEAVVSDFNLFLRRNPDSPEAWTEFSQRKLTYYRLFVRKWVLASDGLEKLVVPYERLTESPVEQFARMIRFFQPQATVDQERLEEIVSAAALEDAKPDGTEVVRNFGVRNRRKLEEFKYFDEAYFSQLESQLADELLDAGYQRRFAA